MVTAITHNYITPGSYTYRYKLQHWCWQDREQENKRGWSRIKVTACLAFFSGSIFILSCTSRSFLKMSAKIVFWFLNYFCCIIDLIFALSFLTHLLILFHIRLYLVALKSLWKSLTRILMFPNQSQSKIFCKIAFILNNTSLAAKGGCKIQNGRQGAPKWQRGEGVYP